MDESTPTPWAAPSDEGATALPPPPVSVVLEPPPRKKRVGLILAIAAIVIAGLGVGGFFVMKGDSKPTYALDRAVTAAQSAKYSSLDMSIASGGQSITMKGQSDIARGLIHFTMDMGAVVGSAATLEAIIDTKSLTMFMASDLFKTAGAPIDTKWVKFDQKTLEAAGQDASAFDQINVGNQLAPVTLFETAKSVKEIGIETVNGGEPLKHFEIVLDMQKVLSLNPLLKSTLAKSGAKLPDDITYHAYITKANEIRRLTYEFSDGDTTATVTIDSHILTTAPTIELPADSDVTDLATLLGSN